MLWGATAAAMIGATMAYALDEKRKRKEAEAKQLAEAEAKAAKLNAAEEQRKAVAAWLESQAILKAQQAPTQNASYQAHMEDKMERIDAEEDAKWEASQAAIQKRVEEKKKDEKSRAADSARWDGLASQGQYAANVPALDNDPSWWKKLVEKGKDLVTKTVEIAKETAVKTIEKGKELVEEGKEFVKNQWQDAQQWVNTNVVQPAKDTAKKVIMTAQNFVTTTVTKVKENYETVKNDPVKWVERKIDQTWPALRATGPGKNGISIVNDIDNKTIINMVVSSFNSLVKSSGGFPYQYEKKPEKFEQRTHSVTIHPTSIAISLSLQSEAPGFIDTLQWMLSPLGKLFQIGILNSPSYGMAQIGPDKYDLIKQNIQLYTNLKGVSDIPFFALNKPQVSTAAMIERVAPAVEVCQEYGCKSTDREIAIALAQNGDGFNANDLRDLLEEEKYRVHDGNTIIDWQKVFNQRKAFTSDKGAYRYYFLNWRASDHNFDTWFMLKRYYNNAMAFEASGKWSMPPGVDWEYIRLLVENTPPSGQ